MACIAAALFQGCRGEACLKRYTLAGTVVDSSLAPLEEVQVRWHYNNPNEPVIVITTTDPQGNYSYSYSTRAALEGSQVEFVKAGYITSVASPYSASEAGNDVCDSITLTRDAVLYPE